MEGGEQKISFDSMGLMDEATMAERCCVEAWIIYVSLGNFPIPLQLIQLCFDVLMYWLAAHKLHMSCSKNVGCISHEQALEAIRRSPSMTFTYKVHWWIALWRATRMVMPCDAKTHLQFTFLLSSRLESKKSLFSLDALNIHGAGALGDVKKN